MNDLRITLVQTELNWQDAQSNRRLLEGELSGLAEGATDLILLPEMFPSAFSPEAGTVAEPFPGPSVRWMLDMAERHDAAVTGSIATKVADRRFNRLVFTTPQGALHYYDKRHLFRMLNEHKRYSAGSEKLLVEWRGWRILPLVCYDLRFPVWSRHTPAEPYDLLLYVANWPAPRQAQWTKLLCARAIENLCYVAGVNRIGTDGRGISYAGQSAVYDPRGEEVLQAGEAGGCFSVTLSRGSLDQWRDHFPAHLDADSFSID